LGLWLAREIYGAGGAVLIAKQLARFQQAILVVVGIEGVG
jgi:tRNA A37 threonylcarbamoyladenosine dehydratase